MCQSVKKDYPASRKEVEAESWDDAEGWIEGGNMEKQQSVTKEVEIWSQERERQREREKKVYYHKGQVFGNCKFAFESPQEA